MKGTYGDYKLVGDQTRIIVAQTDRKYSLNFAGEAVTYDFYEQDEDTWLSVTFRNFARTWRVLDLKDKPVSGLSFDQDTSLGHQVAAQFAEQIQATGEPPKILVYGN
jgi:hypothetical protein